MAHGITEFLRYTCDAGFVRAADRAEAATTPRWQVSGTTRAAIWCLPSLEHLFMDLRAAGARYASALESLELVPVCS